MTHAVAALCVQTNLKRDDQHRRLTYLHLISLVALQTNLKLGTLCFTKGDYGRLKQILKELHKSCMVGRNQKR